MLHGWRWPMRVGELETAIRSGIPLMT